MQFSDYTEIIDNCSLCLTGLKPANLFCTKSENLYFFYKLKPQLNEKGIFFEILLNCDKKVQILVYRKKMIKTLFQQISYKNALSYFGYSNNCSIEKYIECLKKKIIDAANTKEKCFPNEIGLFLGYPVKDVLAFDSMGGEKAICSGYWKVYHDKEQALTTFNMYDKYKKKFKKELNQGQNLLTILKLA